MIHMSNVLVKERVESFHDPIYEEHAARYQFACKHISGGRVLDVACGLGFGTILLSAVARKVYGVDVDQKTVHQAQRLTRTKTNIVIRKADAIKLTFGNNFFDTVVSFETIEHITHWQKFLSEVHRVLKPGGILLLSTPDREVTREILLDTSYRNPFHIHEFTQQELLRVLKPFFWVKEVYGQFLYQPSSLRLWLRDSLRFFLVWDKKKWLKQLLPLGFVLAVPRLLVGMKRDCGVYRLKPRERAYSIVVICHKKKSK